jgi:hypothetical protein
MLYRMTAKLKRITKATNQIFRQHISKHPEIPLEGSEMAFWARHFPFNTEKLLLNSVRNE